MPKIIVKDHKYYFKIRGLGGPKGDKGDTGPAGPQGPQGPYVNVVAGTTTTLPAGSSAQVTVNNIGNTSTLNFGIPQGSKGDKGDAGTPGAQGPRGFAATVNVGETTTGQPGTDASVVNAGNEHDAVLKFTIPKGETGETGETGPQGPAGSVKSSVVAELPEAGESDKYYLVYRDSEGGTITTADGRAQITNDENGGDLTVSQLLGNAEQTTYSGKNLLPSINTTRTRNGVTFTHNEDGSISLSGTASADAAYPINVDSTGNSRNVPLSAGSYIVSGGSATSPTTVYMQAYYGTIGGADRYSMSTFTLEADGTMGAYIYVKSGTNTNGKTIYPMVEAGSTATSYEPYVGGTPAPNPSYPQPISAVTGEQTVKITGKNLVGLQDGTLTSNGVDFAINNGTITASGTTTAGSNAENDNIIGDLSRNGNYPVYADITEANSLELPAGAYTLSAEITKSGNTSVGLAIGVGLIGSRPTTSTKLEVNRTTANGTYTRSATVSVAEGQRVYLSVWYEGNANNKIVGLSISNIQLEEGSTATAYEPYHGQSYEVNLGKNLFSISQDTIITNAYLTNNTTLTFDNLNSVKFVATGTQGAQYLYRIISGLDSTKSYTFSFKAIKNVKGSTGLPYIRIAASGSNDGSTWTGLGFSGNDNPTEGETYSFAKTLTGYSQYRFMLFNNADTPVQIGETTTFFDMQLEEGAQTTYAPYFTPIELAKIGNYQDRIYKNDGKWYIEKQVGKVVLDGTQTIAITNWRASSTSVGWVYPYSVFNSATIPAGSVGAILCDKLIASSFASLFDKTTDNGIALYANTDYSLALRTSDTSLTTASSINTWLSSNPTTVYYALATPTTTEITDETLLSQLNFLASLYEGENNISLVGTGAQGEFTGDYVVYNKYNRHKVYIWSSDDNTWQIIVQ
jgi:hypothetical protein